jgi:hypothetical protein
MVMTAVTVCLRFSVFSKVERQTREEEIDESRSSEQKVVVVPLKATWTLRWWNYCLSARTFSSGGKNDEGNSAPGTSFGCRTPLRALRPLTPLDAPALAALPSSRSLNSSSGGSSGKKPVLTVVVSAR